MDFSYLRIRYFMGYVYHICVQGTMQSTLSLCLPCQTMLLPMPLQPLLLTVRSGFNGELLGELATELGNRIYEDFADSVLDPTGNEYA